MVLRFIGISCQDALIETFDWGQRRTVAEQNV
jgi:hypothetical protein